MKILTPSFSAADLAALASRFWTRVDKNGPVPAHCPELGPCHIWLGSRGNSGRGKIKYRGVSYGAPRVAFLLTHGRWPSVCALHKCDAGHLGCVRPDHLFEGSFFDNMADMFAKGRARPIGAPGESHPRARLTEEKILALRTALGNGESQRSVAARFGVGKSTVGAIAVGRTWRCMGLPPPTRRTKAKASREPGSSVPSRNNRNEGHQ